MCLGGWAGQSDVGGSMHLGVAHRAMAAWRQAPQHCDVFQELGCLCRVLSPYVVLWLAIGCAQADGAAVVTFSTAPRDTHPVFSRCALAGVRVSQRVPWRAFREPGGSELWCGVVTDLTACLPVL